MEVRNARCRAYSSQLNGKGLDDDPGPWTPPPWAECGVEGETGGTAKESGKRLKLREQGHRGIALGDGRTGAEPTVQFLPTATMQRGHQMTPRRQDLAKRELNSPMQTSISLSKSPGHLRIPSYMSKKDY